MIKFLLRVCLIAIILMGLPYISFCQNSANYSFLTNSTGSLALDKNNNAIDMSTGTTQIYGPNIDFPYTPILQNIGFTFYFMGQPYTNFSVNPDGQFRFGTNLMSGQQQGFALNEPKLFPMNYSGKTTASGKVHFKVQGSTPNSVFILEWKDILIPDFGTSSTTASKFQIRLYENGGVIEYVYGTMVNTFSGTITYILGFASGNASGTIGQVANVTTTPTYNSTSSTSVFNTFPANAAMTGLNSAADGSRRIFRFTPPVANTPSNLVLSNVTPSSTTLSWTDLATNEIGYQIYRSTDGVNYSLVSILPPNTTISVQNGLSQATNYFWRVAAFTEGHLTNFIVGNATTTSCSISGGVKTIPGTYPSLTAAVAALQTNGIQGPVILELQATYPANVETLPISLSIVPCASAVNTITIRPAAGVVNTGLVTFNSGSSIEINGGNYWIIDGRSGGSGTASNLTFSNASGSSGSSALKFNNNASNNIIRYVSFSGTGTAATTGVITFIGSPTESSSNNLIDNCSIDGNAGSTASPTSNVSRNGIYSLGNSLAQHSNNIVSNCKIFNWFVASASSTCSGIFLSSGNTGWTITGNSFYQTSPRVSVSGINPLIAINISNSTTGNNFSISNNYIGGRAALCGGNAWTQSGADNQFIGISLSVGAASASSVQGNTIKNINTSTTYFEPFYGIYVTNGNVNIGNITGNVIGSSIGTGSISVLSGNTTSSGGNSRGIAITPVTYGVTNISHNFIGSITLAGTSAQAPHSFSGIYNFSTSAIIDSNVIGSLSSGNSIYASNSASSANSQQIVGILSSTTGSSSINKNIVANMRNAYTPAGNTFNIIRGIVVFGTTFTTQNVVRDLYAMSNATGSGMNASVIGIQYSNTNSGITSFSQNTIYALSNLHASAAVSVIGLFYSGQVQSGTIERNMIHSLSVASPAAVISGMYAGGGIAVYLNNMIRLGIDTFGADLTIPCSINGILDSLDRSNYFHNTVFIGGNNVGISSNNTFAFKSYVTTSNRDFRNNIFINYRSNTNSGGKHYAIQVGGTGTNPAGLVLTNNVYESSGNGGVFGRYNSADVADLAAWRAAIGGDANSKDYSPMLADPAAGFPDLHLSVGPPFGPASSAEGNGTNVSISDDFDGEIRSNLSPIDIGADAGNYAKPIYLGNYPDTNVLENGNFVLWSDSFPAGISRLIATASSDFTGVLSADPLTGAITVTNAMPIGVYQISVWANGSLVRTFSLTVDKVPCNPAAFTNASSVSAGTSPFAIATGDFNNDGKQDIATASGNAVNIRIGNGSGNFAVSTNINLSSSPQAIAVGDINGDGNLDIVTGNSGSPYITSLFGNGKGAFGISNTTGGNSNSGSIILADYNNDGKMDILSVSTSSLNVYSNNGFGVFSLAGSFSSGGLVYSGMAASDFNRDGNIDLAILNRGSSTYLIRLGNGAGSFTGSTSFSVGNTPYYIATGDFNHDNKTDIATANSAAGSVSIRLGNGLGGFSGTTEELVGTTPYGLLINDMNGDGHQDIVCAANVSSRITIRFGNGTGGFNGTSNVSVNSGPRSICIGDFNGDSIPDLAATHSTLNNFSVRLGSANEINLQHNGNNILDGSTQISSAIGTDFGNVFISTPISKTYKLKNTKSYAVVIFSYSVTGLNGSEFLITGLHGYDSLYAGDSLTFTLTFTPLATGIRNATVHLINNDCDEADYDFAVQGNGVFNCNVNLSDNNICTVDACSSIAGISHVFVNPDDGNACTIDGCDPVTGIFHTLVQEICGNFLDDDCNGLIDENCREILNLTTFIEGFYLGNGTMRPTVDPVYYPILCDTMIVSLHRSSSPYSLEFADTATIDIHGEGRFDFPYAVLGNSYYIVTHHRNALETWSGAPIFFNDTVINYSFTDSLPQAYGNNLFDLGDGNFALWSGDISGDNINSYGQQDGFIQFRDYFYMEQALFVTSLGYTPADLTGDGIVESLDYMFMENSYFYLVMVMRP